jgi:3D domain-containing protein
VPLVALAAALAAGCPPPHPGPPRPPRERRIERPRWLGGTLVTEYYPVPERWFAGRRVRAPGIPGRHRVDWLYSARGLPMEGEGIGLDGRVYHYAGPYGLPWLDAAGRRTRPCADGSWTRGRPAWLDRSAGRVRFAPGRSRPLAYWRSVAVDPRLIPLGSRIFVPAYCSLPGRGWLVARDTGGAIIGRHLDVFRPPPASPAGARSLRAQRVLVVPPGTRYARRPPRCQARHVP